MQKKSVFGDSRLQMRTAMGFLLVLVVVVVYISVQSRPVDVPHEVMAALRSQVSQERLENTELSASRRGQTYIIELVEVTSDGRRFVYGYEVTPDLQVISTGMTVGIERKNPLLVLFGLLAGAAFFSFVVFFVVRKLFIRRCPSCGNVLGKEELTLFAGAIARGGESLAPIILTQEDCSVCGYKHRRVAPLPGHRAGSINITTLVRPSQEATVDRVHNAFLDSRTMTYADWEDKLKQLREEYEEG
jgi:hypothetical protein